MTQKTVDVQTLVVAGGVALLGFLGGDFVKGRDNRTASVETVVREVIDLKLSPLTSDFAEVKAQLRDFSRENRTATDQLRARMGDAENRMALAERSQEATDARVERLSEIIRERSIGRDQAE